MFERCSFVSSLSTLSYFFPIRTHTVNIRVRVLHWKLNFIECQHSIKFSFQCNISYIYGVRANRRMRRNTRNIIRVLLWYLIPVTLVIHWYCTCTVMRTVQYSYAVTVDIDINCLFTVERETTALCSCNKSAKECKCDIEIVRLVWDKPSVKLQSGISSAGGQSGRHQAARPSLKLTPAPSRCSYHIQRRRQHLWRDAVILFLTCGYSFLSWSSCLMTAPESILPDTSTSNTTTSESSVLTSADADADADSHSQRCEQISSISHESRSRNSCHVDNS